MNCDILKAKRLKRKYERAWRRENSASNRSQYRAAINPYNFLLEKSKCNLYSNIVAENQGNPKALWNFFKKILHRSSVAVLPDYTNKTDLANTFCKFFYDKILKIRSTLQSPRLSLVTVLRWHMSPPFKRSRALIEISSKTTGRCQTSALYLNSLRRWWQSS